MKKQKVGSLDRSEVVIIEGEAGIGKTKLLEEFMDDAEKCHMRVIHAEGDVSHAQSTYYIVNTLMRAFFDVEGESREKYIMSIINEDAEITENIGLLSDIISTYVSNFLFRISCLFNRLKMPGIFVYQLFLIRNLEDFCIFLYGMELKGQTV